jgi:enediyne biosynthesis protein E4
MVSQPALRRFIPSLVALVLTGILFGLSLAPRLSDFETAELASHFQFAKLPLPELPGYPYKRTREEMVREVHPSLHHIRSWLSFVGAAVSLADLDGDGLPNDVVYVDPRIDQVIVAPAPGTKNRFTPFAMSASPLPFERSFMAPMGARAGDFNEDGFTDILAYYWGRSPILFLQRPDGAARGPVSLSADRFVPSELVEPHQTWFTCAAGQADLDGDGHADLIIGNYNPDGTRVLDSAATGIEEMMHTMSRAYNGGMDRLFLWEGSGTGANPSARFREAAGALEHDVAGGWTFAIGAADLDGDLLPEIYFAQDFGPDRLLHNRSERGKLQFALLHGQRTFTTPRSLVLGCDSFNGMGVDFGDLNGDGWPDIVVSNVSCDFGLHESNFVFLSTGRPDDMHRGIAPYRNESERMGLSRSGWTWDVKLADFDNDGALEVVRAAGFTKGTVNRWPEMHELALGNDELMPDPRFAHPIQPGDDISGDDHNSFFARAKDTRYYDISTRIGFGDPMLSRGIATADLDGDGRLDFALANNWGPSFLFHNTAPNAGSFLGLHLRLPVGPKEAGATVARLGHPQRWIEGPSRPAMGASATVHLADGQRLIAFVDGGNGHSGQRSPDLHFGLGKLDPSRPLRVEVRWRGTDGHVRAETFSLDPDHWHTLLLGEPVKTGQGANP